MASYSSLIYDKRALASFQGLYKGKKIFKTIQNKMHYCAVLWFYLPLRKTGDNSGLHVFLLGLKQSPYICYTNIIILNINSGNM